MGMNTTTIGIVPREQRVVLVRHVPKSTLIGTASGCICPLRVTFATIVVAVSREQRVVLVSHAPKSTLIGTASGY